MIFLPIWEKGRIKQSRQIFVLLSNCIIQIHVLVVTLHDFLFLYIEVFNAYINIFVSLVAGEIISALNETGLLQKTLVIFTADHGELAMEHRQFYKMSMYEASSHIPLLIMGPNIKSQLVSNVVSLVDIYPTMLGKQHFSRILCL